MAVRQEPLLGTARRAKQAYRRAGRFLRAFDTHKSGCPDCAEAVRFPLRPINYCEAGNAILALAHAEIDRGRRLQIDYERSQGHQPTSDFSRGDLLGGLIVEVRRALGYRFVDDPQPPRPRIQREYEEYGARLREARSEPEITSWLPVLIDLELPMRPR